MDEESAKKEEEEGPADHQRQQPPYEWSAHYDDDGNLFYYNDKTEESSWDEPPDGYNPPPTQTNEAAVTASNTETIEPEAADVTTKEEEEGVDDNGDVAMEREVTAHDATLEAKAASDNNTIPSREQEMDEQQPVANDSATAEQEKTPAVDPVEATIKEANNEDESTDASKRQKRRYDWSAHYDGSGQLYYYNETTEESSWEAPTEGFNPPQGDPPDTVVTETAAETSATDPDATQSFDWSAHYDEDGNIYYHNTKTGESAWEPPEEGFNPPEMADDGNDDPQASQLTTDTDTPWVAFRDEEGQEYYFNEKTNQTSWDRPAKYRPYDPDGNAEMEEEASVTKSPEPELEAAKSPSPEPEPEIDPAVKKLQEAESALNQPDSVLEPNVMESVLEIVHANDNNPAKAITALIDNYTGQTAVCGLLSKWLVDLEEPEDSIRENIQNVINKIAKERFTKEAADGILDLSKSEAAFLSEMMDSPRWRKLLIDLTATHKDSAVLLYCLRAISKRGHHREIAKRINQSEHFAVFNAMLSSELSVLGSQAVSAGSDVAASGLLDELIQDLRRSCSSTSYTYVYSIHLLQRLIEKAKEQLKSNQDARSHDGVRLARAVLKWEYFGELLGSAMIDPSVSQSVAGSSPLFRKRRLDVALTVSDLYQREKRVRRAENGDQRNGNGHGGDLEEALSTMLRRHSMGVQINDAVLDKLLPSGLETDTRGVGELLIQNPLAIRALLGHLYKPGSARISTPSGKNKCAQLVALASIAAEKAANKEAKASIPDEVDDETTDELALTRMITQGSQLCERLETVVSFLVTTDPENPGAADSPGQTLCDTALNCAPVALGVIIWAREFTRSSDFASLASFATLSSSILSLVRLISLKHPFVRADSLQIGLSFLGHSNSDVSTKRVYAIREASLRLLLFLLVKGEIVPVLSSMMKRLQSVTGPELDATLVQYFIAGVLEVVKPPVSPLFVHMFCRLLSVPKASDAIKSSFFAASNKKKLVDLLTSFKDVRLYDGRPLCKEDQTAIVSLESILS